MKSITEIKSKFENIEVIVLLSNEMMKENNREENKQLH
jgi:hypothetical protein